LCLFFLCFSGTNWSYHAINSSEYAATFKEDAAFDDIAKQFILMERHARDAKTGLLYHGWDESKQQRWANPITGRSPNFWGRPIGWYATCPRVI
jgi:unsaturated rhamnogalacturonyl hydrolase